MVTFDRAKVSSYRVPIVTFLQIYAFQRYCRFCAPERHFSHPTFSLPQISPCSPRSRWMSFRLRRAKRRCWANCTCN